MDCVGGKAAGGAARGGDWVRGRDRGFGAQLPRIPALSRVRKVANLRFVHEDEREEQEEREEDEEDPVDVQDEELEELRALADKWAPDCTTPPDQITKLARLELPTFAADFRATIRY